MASMPSHTLTQRSFNPIPATSLYSFHGSDSVIENEEGLAIGASTTLEVLFRHAAIVKYTAVYMALRNVNGPANRRQKMIGSVLTPDVSSQGVAAALMAHGADIEVVGPDGSRVVNIMHYFSKPEKILSPGEKVKSFLIPSANRDSSIYQSVDYLRSGQAVCGVAAWAQKSEDTLDKVRLVLSGCTAYPIYLERISGFLQGKECTTDQIEEVIRRLGEERLVLHTPQLMMGGHLFNLSKTLIKRALMTL